MTVFRISLMAFFKFRFGSEVAGNNGEREEVFTEAYGTPHNRKVYPGNALCPSHSYLGCDFFPVGSETQ